MSLRFRIQSFSVLVGVLVAVVGAFSARSVAAIEHQLGDALPAMQIKTVTGEVFDTSAPGDGVTVFLFDNGTTDRTRTVSEQLRAALSNPALAEVDVRLLYVLARSSASDDVPDYVRAITPNVITARDVDGGAFETFNVIVLPTVIISGKGAGIVYVSSGIAPRFGIVVQSAALLAAGKIDVASFNQTLHPTPIDAEANRLQNKAARITRTARRMADRGMVGSAHKLYLDALEIVPAFVPALVGCGDLALTAGDLDEAGRRFAEALDADPHATDAAMGLAQVYLQQGDERLEEAESLLGGVIGRDATIARAHDLLGQVYLRLDEPEKAEACFSKRDALLAREKEQPRP